MRITNLFLVLKPNVMAIHQAKILLVKDIERDEIEFISKTLSSFPIATIDYLTKLIFARAELVEEVQIGSGKVFLLIHALLCLLYV